MYATIKTPLIEKLKKEFRNLLSHRFENFDPSHMWLVIQNIWALVGWLNFLCMFSFCLYVMVSIMGRSTHRTVYPMSMFGCWIDVSFSFIMIIYHFDGKKIQILKNIALCYHDDDLCIYINFSNCTHPMFNWILMVRVAP